MSACSACGYPLKNGWCLVCRVYRHGRDRQDRVRLETEAARIEVERALARLVLEINEGGTR